MKDFKLNFLIFITLNYLSFVTFVNSEDKINQSKMLNLMKEYNIQEKYEFVDKIIDIQMNSNISIKRNKIAKFKINKNNFSDDNFYTIKYHYLDPLGITPIFNVYSEDSEFNKNHFLNEFKNLANCNISKNSSLKGNELLFTKKSFLNNIDQANIDNDFFIIYFTFCYHPLDISTKESRINNFLFTLEIIKSYSDNRLKNIIFDKNLFSLTTLLSIVIFTFIIFYFNDCEYIEDSNQNKEIKVE